MTRVLSALALLPLVFGTILFLPPLATVGLAVVAAGLAFVEYARLARAAEIGFPTLPAGAATLAVATVLPVAPDAVGLVVLAGGLVVAVTALADGGLERALARVGAAAFAILYLGMPIGALAATRIHIGREALVALMLTVIVSDIAQYYGGRTLGRRPLAPVVSPKKTVEGAFCGVVVAGLAMVAVGPWGLPGWHPLGYLTLGVGVALLGIAGDLFESRLKRSSGVKDSSTLIPGHGGLLDRIDALLFAAPAYYGVVMLSAGGVS